MRDDAHDRRNTHAKERVKSEGEREGEDEGKKKLEVEGMLRFLYPGHGLENFR